MSTPATGSMSEVRLDMTSGQKYMGIVDYVMLAVMLLGSMGIGVYFAIVGRKNTTKAEYLLGGRKLGAIPVCLSLFATYQSAIGLLGVPAEVYTYGIMNIYGYLGTSLSYVVGIFTVVPLMHPLKITSVNEYLELRFNSRSLRLLATIIGIFSSVSYMTIALLSPALALQTAVGLPLWLSIVLIGSIGTIYTAIGGLKSVVWTDVFQTVIMLGGVVVILIKGSMDVGGIDKIMNIARDNGRTVVDNVNPDPRDRHTVWGLVVGQAFYWVSGHYSQSSVQRIIATSSQQQARMIYILAIPLVVTYGCIMILSGLVLVGYFFNLQCDPLAAGYIQNRNQLMPYFVMHSLSSLPGVPGLYMATIFSGALSTLSSGINSLAANTVEDILGGLLANRRESTVTTLSKIIVCIYGAGIIGLAYLAKSLSGPVTQTTYTVLSATSGPLLGVFLLGAGFYQANSTGSMCGLLIGLGTSVWLAMGSFMYGVATPPLPVGSTSQCQALNSSSPPAAAWNTSYTTSLPAAAWNTSYTTSPPAAAWNTSYTTSPWVSSQNLMLTTAAGGGGTAGRQFSMYDLSYVWSPVIGTVLTIIPGLLLSVIIDYFKKSKHQPDPKLLYPFMRKFWNLNQVKTADQYDLDFEPIKS